jgi:hypothetical protein
MTPLGIAREHCANWHEGICSGIDFRRDGSMFMFRDGGKPCLLNERKRCSYFESAVLPIGKKEEWAKRYPGEARAFEEGADQYTRQHSGIPGLSPRRRKCPDCGTMIGPRKRYCAVCGEHRRKETNAANQRKWRQKAGLTVI